MKKYAPYALICLLFVLIACTKEQLNDALNSTSSELSNDEVIAGLKEALNVGTDTSVTILHKLDGYFLDETVKILLPEEAQVMYANLTKVPLASEAIKALMDQTVLAMNRAAEDAASEAKPIFISAIKGITIGDGFTILKGADTAATTYLRGKTYDSLYITFQPKIDVSLNKPLVAGISAQSAYSNLITLYNNASVNGLLYDQITTNSLSEHVTRKGLNGLFLKVAVQEKNIRKDPIAQVTDLLKKVFGQK
jgi:hypothetical protein